MGGVVAPSQEMGGVVAPSVLNQLRHTKADRCKELTTIISGTKQSICEQRPPRCWKLWAGQLLATPLCTLMKRIIPLINVKILGQIGS
jgi:hypothetical protein